MCLAVGQNSLTILIDLILIDLIPTIQSMYRTGFNCKFINYKLQVFPTFTIINNINMYVYVHILDSQLDLACLKCNH